VEASSRAPRVGVIGARRKRQGLGPFIVRDLLQAGAQVPCFWSTSTASAALTLQALRDHAGAAPTPYLDLHEMIAHEALDALAISSPAEIHQSCLETALAAGLSVLCEKPFLWDPTSRDPESSGPESHGPDALAPRARRIVDGFAAAGLLLRENCQWPYTLPVFEKLHPGSLASPPRRFEMTMQPANPGVSRLADSLPHPLSLLQALTPGRGRVEQVEISGTPEPAAGRRSNDAQALRVRFRHRTGASSTDVEIELRRSDTSPRRAHFAVDGRSAHRLVDDAYNLSFADGDRSVPLDDPLTQLIRDFARDLAGLGSASSLSEGEDIVERMEMMDEIVAGYRRAEARGS
jgi:predicted dehydrogenase